MSEHIGPFHLSIAKEDMADRRYWLKKGHNVTGYYGIPIFIGMCLLINTVGAATHGAWRIAAASGGVTVLLFYVGVELLATGILISERLEGMAETVTFMGTGAQYHSILTAYNAALKQGKGEQAAALVRQIAQLSQAGQTDELRGKLQKLAYGN